jgi:hypothetical protein
VRITHIDTVSLKAQTVPVTQTRTSPIPSEEALAEEARAVLQEIGAALDKHRRLRVYARGIVAVDPESPETSLLKENGDERQGKTRSATGSRKRSARREGSARGSRQASTAPRIGRDMLRAAYKGQVTELLAAYPDAQLFDDQDGIWLLAHSSILPSLRREAAFLIALPYQSGMRVRGWGFWTAPGHHWWIGPRHTNFGDGSICAFSPSDDAWSEGGDLRTLLDLYSVWALRHLHLEVFDRWPGKQYTLVGADPQAQALYRQKECKDDELCGCGSETQRYSECCKPFDLRGNIIEQMTAFLRATGPGGFANRQPPQPVVEFIEGRSGLPQMADARL